MPLLFICEANESKVSLLKKKKNLQKNQLSQFFSNNRRYSEPTKKQIVKTKGKIKSKNNYQEFADKIEFQVSGT